MFRHAILALITVALLGACNREAPPPAPAATPAVVEAPAAEPAAPSASPASDPKAGSALSITAADLGTELGDDGRIVTATDTFAPNDTIIVAITTNNAGSAPANAEVTARWIDPDGKVVNEESRQQDFAGTQFVSFRIAEPKGFKHGRYK